MAVAVLGACGGSGADETVDTVDSTPATTIDLADGALIRNDGVRLDADGTPVTTLTATTLSSDAAAPTTAVDDAATETTVAGGAGATDGAATGGVSTSGGAAGSTTGGSTDGGTTTDGAVGGPGIGPGEGELVISGTTYRFTTALCQISNDSAEIGGTGTASDSTMFEASIFFEVDDVDGDGTPERVLEIFVDVDSDDVNAPVPAFSASTVDVLGNGSPGQLTFEIVGQRITGTGTIVDINGVAFPEDEPGPLAFDVRCA